MRHTLNGSLRQRKGGLLSLFSGLFAVTFSPDSRLVMCVSANLTVIPWNSATGAKRHTVKGPLAWFNGMAFSPDGKLIASASEAMTVKLWDFVTGAICHTLKGHADHVHKVVFSPDGKLIASALQDGTIILWNSATGATCRTLVGHSDRVNSVASWWRLHLAIKQSSFGTQRSM